MNREEHMSKIAKLFNIILLICMVVLTVLAIRAIYIVYPIIICIVIAVCAIIWFIISLIHCVAVSKERKQRRRKILVLSAVFIGALLDVVLICAVRIYPVLRDDKLMMNVSRYGEEISEKVVECFINEDAEGLKSLFCVSAQRSWAIDKDIQAAFDYIDGDIVSYEIYSGGDGSSVKDGKLVELDVSNHIEIETETGNVYIIVSAVDIVNKKHSTSEGITGISVRKKKDKLDGTEESGLITIGW